MTWTNPLATALNWTNNISNYEEKLAVARRMAAMVQDGDVIGAGSGSTAFVTLQEIAKLDVPCSVIPTSREIEMAALALGLRVTSLMADKPDWCYDGADEVDPEGNLIKGRGGAMYREKLVMTAAKRRFILVDHSKFVDNLGSKFPVPVEVDQNALNLVETALLDLGAQKTELRMAKGKDGPIITESGHFIIDAFFDGIDKDLEKSIKGIVGVVESGLFWGFKPEIVTNG